MGNDKRIDVSRRGFLGSTALGLGATIVTGKAASDNSMPEPGAVSRIQSDIAVPMRDGTELAADVYLPDEDRGNYPTLVSRTPYDKEGYAESGEFFAREGYAVVIQDVRGKFGSEGEFYPYRSEGLAEGKDSYDTVEWAAEQTWSNGRVGTFGISYLAGTQWALAHNEKLPPHLEAMAPGFPVASYYGQGAYSGGAALLSHNLDYLNGFAVERYNREHPDEADELTMLEKVQEAMPQLFWNLPVHPFEPHEEVGYDWVNDWHSHETYDEYWEAQDHTKQYDTIDVPVLTYGGWYDIFAQGAIRNYRGLREDAATKRARERTSLVMGPYTHGRTAERAQGQVTGHAYEFPPNSTYEIHRLVLDWFDRHLKEEHATSSDAPSRVRLYVPGFDEWIGASEFPLPETRYTTYYLASDGNANVSNVSPTEPDYSGRLQKQQPCAGANVDTYEYDPSDPVMSVGGYNTHWDGGVADRATAYHMRDDILVYETDILEEDMAVIGPITVTLHASTTAVDTDFVVNITDVDPGSRAGALWVAEGARRGRIGDVEANPRSQNTYSELSPLVPGEVYAWKIAVWPTARVFEAGHRLRLEVSSSNFPRYSRNLNTGEGLDGSEMVTAEQTIYHDEEHPSHVELPIVPINRLESKVIEEMM